jgi:hypothetical protein
MGGAVALIQAPADAGGGTVRFEVPSLDGSGNNRAHPDWGAAGSGYSRVTAADYADGVGQMIQGPDVRSVSNRIFADEATDEQGQLFSANIFSERQVSQWGWVWGQFVDHNIGLVLGRESGDPQGEDADIALHPEDPMELLKVPATIGFTRSPWAAGSGKTTPRQQVNTVSSYLDASAVYGGTGQRLTWMRDGAKLYLPGDYLPRRDARGDASTAPQMELGGALFGDPGSAVVAGDLRANENIEITAVQTLFAREHNRIVDLLPATLPEETRFQIARRVVIAEIQYITYQQFLPAMGVTLPAYAGYDARVNADLSTEFATTAFRVHSMVHGDVVLETNASRYTAAELAEFEAEGLMPTLSADRRTVQLTVVLNKAVSNPTLVPRLQLGPLLSGIGLKAQYRNDELVEELLRNIICADPPTCVSDLAAVDLARSRDHGIPTYNQLRKAYGLAPKKSFKAVTGESSEAFPSDPQLTPGDEIDDPDSTDYTRLTNLFGTDLAPDDERSLTDPVSFTRRTPLAARLKAIYGNVDALEAYPGIFSEPHLPGSELGELATAMWTRQFQALRTGDRFYYGNQGATLDAIRKAYGIDFRRTLGDVIAANTDQSLSSLPGNVFFVGGQVPPSKCAVSYRVTSQRGTGSGTFTARVRVTNFGTSPLGSWTLRYRYDKGQTVTEVQGATVRQDGPDVPVSGAAPLAPGQTRQVTVSGTWTGANTDPDRFTLNTLPCG